MIDDPILIGQLIAYWNGPPELGQEARRLCRDLSADLARLLPREELSAIQDDPYRYRAELSLALHRLESSAAGSREVQVAQPPFRPSDPRKEPEPASSVLPAAASRSPKPAANPAVQGDGNILMTGDIAHSSLQVKSSVRPAQGRNRGPAAELEEKIRILFLGANPSDSTRLRLDAEVREIEQSLAMAKLGARFELHQKWAVRPSELQMHLLRHRPHLLHFSGHGSREHAIYLEGDDGRSHPVEGVRLARLLAQFNQHLRCVVLNACYSEGQAHAIAEHIDCVVGMGTAVLDQAAIRFASVFYRSLAFGCNVQRAYDMSCADIELGELGQDSIPQLIAVRQDAEEILFAGG